MNEKKLKTLTHKPLIHFAHANGFPSPTYNYLFELLSDEYDIAYIEKIGHNPKFPITANWPHLIEEVRESIEKAQHEHGSKAPVIGLGHSLGAFLTLLCAYKYPHLFKAIILMEPPLQTGLTALAWRGLSLIGKEDKFSPAGLSKHRRVLFKDKEEVVAAFTGKAFFKRFHPKCLADYIKHGFTPVDEGVRLNFEREHEVAIFRTLPSNLVSVSTKLPIPVLAIQGKYSELTQTKILPRALKTLKLPTVTFAGGHMFPLEQPEETVTFIKDILKRFN